MELLYFFVFFCSLNLEVQLSFGYVQKIGRLVTFVGIFRKKRKGKFGWVKGSVCLWRKGEQICDMTPCDMDET
jgi:hypothetical protein